MPKWMTAITAHAINTCVLRMGLKWKNEIISQTPNTNIFITVPICVFGTDCMMITRRINPVKSKASKNKTIPVAVKNGLLLFTVL